MTGCKTLRPWPPDLPADGLRRPENAKSQLAFDRARDEVRCDSSFFYEGKD
jgi:hypothetical protein